MDTWLSIITSIYLLCLLTIVQENSIMYAEKKYYVDPLQLIQHELIKFIQ